jgi:hypothetical protein
MLKRAGSHALHLLVEALLGALAIAAVAACVLAWRLAQGPIDITPLLRRWPAMLSTEAGHLAVGRASLAWEGFDATDQPLDIRLNGVDFQSADGRLTAGVGQARISLAVAQLLLGRAVPRTILIDGARARLVLPPSTHGPAAPPPPPADVLRGLFARDRPFTAPPWFAQLRHLAISDAAFTLHDASLGPDIAITQARLEIGRPPDRGASGQARLTLADGGVQTSLTADATAQADGTRLTIATTPVSPAALGRVVPGLAPVAGVDLPVALTLQAAFGPALNLVSAQLKVEAGAGTLQAGRGSVALRHIEADLSARPAELRLDRLRVDFAQPAGLTAPAPVLTASASATAAAGRVHAAFGIKIDQVAMADLGRYWPAGTGGGARPWLVQNVTAGRAHDAHIDGALDIPADFSDPQVTALSGGLVADDVTLFWLRPIPGLTHVRARVTVQSPDALLVTMEAGGQDRLRLTPGSSIRITKLEEKHQFGDIDASLSGPLPDALALLNNPRLNLLARSKMDMTDPSGEVEAHLTLHVPLEDRVTMDQIPIAATAHLARVHLGGVAGGYNLDDGDLTLHVTDDGLSMQGRAALAGIPAQLALGMDFRAGPPDQVLQHATADGTATPDQLARAGLPPAAVHVLTGGTTNLRVAYDGRRDDSATLQLNADLARAAIATPFGWSKPSGQAANADARILLDHGHLAGIDRLRADGPGLSIVSRAQVTAGRPSTLLLEHLDIGGTRAHGRIGFPVPGRDSYSVVLNGPLLDLSAYLARPASTQPASSSPPPGQDDAVGPPWSVSLGFDRLQLARAKTLSPFTLDAASNGRHIVHARLDAGAPGELSASITPNPQGRHLGIQAADAGLVLRALGVADNLRGGRLDLDANYRDSLPAAPLSGTATLTQFNLLAAPAIGRLLQAMTLYGLADVLRGPGLRFAKLVAPFTWQRRVLTLANARAFSPSLGLTAQGDIDLARHAASITGTVVPAYFFNQLLGDLPIVGRVFSPEKGGGVFAARYSVRGPLSDPKVGVNPLSALTPGILREAFGLLKPRETQSK